MNGVHAHLQCTVVYGTVERVYGIYGESVCVYIYKVQSVCEYSTVKRASVMYDERYACSERLILHVSCTELNGRIGQCSKYGSLLGVRCYINLRRECRYLNLRVYFRASVYVLCPRRVVTYFCLSAAL